MSRYPFCNIGHVSSYIDARINELRVVAVWTSSSWLTASHRQQQKDFQHIGRWYGAGGPVNTSSRSGVGEELFEVVGVWQQVRYRTPAAKPTDSPRMHCTARY